MQKPGINAIKGGYLEGGRKDAVHHFLNIATESILFAIDKERSDNTIEKFDGFVLLTTSRKEIEQCQCKDELKRKSG